MPRQPSPSIFTLAILGPALGDAFRKLDPRWLARNPVIFVTAVAALMATILLGRDLTRI